MNREIIKDYAEQYYQHVKAFPRYISATHSICEDLEKRRILLENLQDEENKFQKNSKVLHLYTMKGKFREIAETKILKKFYGVKSKEGLEFFEAHKSADVIHRAECEKLLDSLSKDEQKKLKRLCLLLVTLLNF